MEDASPQSTELQRLRIVEEEHVDIEDESVLPYLYVENLGHGQNAVVDKIKHTKTDLVYARKSIRVSASKFKSATEDFKKEIQIIHRLKQHHHMIRVVSSYNTKNKVVIVMDPAADGGDLKTFLSNFTTEKDLGTRMRMEFVLRRSYGCLASALAFMHQHRVRHRDIKPENILLHRGSVLYADFGDARDYSDRALSFTEDHPGPFTRKYCAPEVKDYDKRSWKSDIFSLGCVYLLMYTAIHWPSKSEMISYWRFYEQLDTIDQMLGTGKKELEVLRCMRSMLKHNMDMRPSAVQIMEVLGAQPRRYFCEQCGSESGRVLIPLSRIANMIISGRRADSTPSLAMTNFKDVTARSTGCIVLQDSVSLIPSGLSSDGIRTFELVRTVTRAYEYAQTVVTYKECVYDWAYQLPTLGIRHRKPRPYGNIPPSLRTYPIISEFGDFEWDLLQEGSITDIRKAFDMFMLDPFVQDANGASLYHIALATLRLDVCQLLDSHNVRHPLSYVDLVAYASKYLTVPSITTPSVRRWPLWLWQYLTGYGLHLIVAEFDFHGDSYWRISTISLEEFCHRVTLDHFAGCHPKERHAVKAILLQCFTRQLSAYRFFAYSPGHNPKFFDLCMATITGPGYSLAPICAATSTAWPNSPMKARHIRTMSW